MEVIMINRLGFTLIEIIDFRHKSKNVQFI